VRHDLPVTKEADVHPAKLDGARWFAGGRHCVFTWAEEKEKGNDDEVRNGCPKGGTLLAIVPNDNLNGPHGQRKLGLWRWILIFVRLV
jgi:hypothetical protein